MMRNSQKALKTLVEGYFNHYPAEAAALLENLSPDEAVRLLQKEPLGRWLSVFEKFTPDFGAQILPRLGSAAAELLQRLDPMFAAALLARLEESVRNACLDALPPASAGELRELMNYPPDTAGTLMDPRAVTFRPGATVRDALTRLRGLRGRRVQDLFLVDEEGRLVRGVALQDVATASPQERLDRLPGGPPVSVGAMTTREELLELLERHELAAVPVVDVERRLLGVIPSDALVTAAQEEASADLQTMVGASPDERALSKPAFAVRKRLPWLEINLLTAFLAAAVVGLFQGTIARFTALAVLLPVVAGQSGNTGAQALAVTMRGLFLREIRVRHWLEVSLKELSVGFINGVLVAFTTSLAVYAWSRSAGLALVIGLSMVLSMMIAGLAGSAVPLVLAALGQDPAQSSSIILTTITDVTGFFSFLGIATLLAGML